MRNILINMYHQTQQRRWSLWRVASQSDYYASGSSVYLRRLAQCVNPQPRKDEKAFGLSFTEENYLWISLLLPLPSPFPSHSISWSVRRAPKLPQRTSERWFIPRRQSCSFPVFLSANLHKRLCKVLSGSKKTNVPYEKDEGLILIKCMKHSSVWDL